MIRQANWIRPAADFGDVAPIFRKSFDLCGAVKDARLSVTALGVYEATLNGRRVGEYVLAPGWTAYAKRLQYQVYDVTDLLRQSNELTVLVGKGWYRSRFAGMPPMQQAFCKNPAGLLARLDITYQDGTEEVVFSDDTWSCGESCVRFSEIYDGEEYDASHQPAFSAATVCFDGPTHTLIPQQGEEIREHEHLFTARIFTTPKGETIVDFGQEITGYVEAELVANKGEILDLSFAEVLDKDGNFYTLNYGSAKSRYHYICRDGRQHYKPKLTFFAFRYIRVNEFPGGVSAIRPETFSAIAVHSNIRRTGRFSCSNPLLNQLYSNIVWGQKCNFLDVPTDCPQRDERLGWTGDAQAFMRAACLNFDVERFFTKWLNEIAACQHENGCVQNVVPDLWDSDGSSAAWGDAATICPWQLYLSYGNIELLREQFPIMRKWVDYIRNTSKEPDLWIGGTHFGDWLGLDAPQGSYTGSSRYDLIASAFFAHSTSLLIKAGKVLQEDVSVYEALYPRIVAAFRERFPEYKTQTECVLAICFRLAEDHEKTAAQLADMIAACGGHLQTGFVGTPHLLHALSRGGNTELAYSLLLREKYPSWLYQVTKGATTMWEHWDGIMEDGSFWSPDMNSFNHYAYGAVADWLYTEAAGIQTVEEAPGYAKVRLAPKPDKRLDWLDCSLDTRHGLVVSRWQKAGDCWRYELQTPVAATVVIAGEEKQVAPGSYLFYSKIND